MTDYLNPSRIYPYSRSVHVGLELGDNGEVIRVNPTVKESLTTEDEVVYSTPICSGKCCAAAPVRENLTTENAESAEKCPTAKPGTETVPNCGTETRQSAGTECNWCDPNQDRLQFRVSWWKRSLGGKHHWFSVTEHHKANYCPMCGRKLEVEG